MADLAPRGEMAGRPEGGAVPPTHQSSQSRPSGRRCWCFARGRHGWRSFAPPSALPGISPTRGEIGSF
ncbi:hypothetical protein FJ419_14545 [Mesorhizobium sp. B2-6-2]|nr:hypothetical protein FJ419_14545 [Mesorhizobium sp. B2-6-2]